MINDEIIWNIINPGFCSYKVKTLTKDFCRNKYNVTGLCKRGVCPLANNKYATIMEDEGDIYLFTKTIERAHSPLKLWNKQKLSNNKNEAHKQIDSALQFWPKGLIQNCHNRNSRLRNVLSRSRQLELKHQPDLIVVKSKTEKRDRQREKKAYRAAKIEQGIEGELVSRLQADIYGDLYKDEIPNVDKAAFEKFVEKEGIKESTEIEYVEEYEDNNDQQIIDIEDIG